MSFSSEDNNFDSFVYNIFNFEAGDKTEFENCLYYIFRHTEEHKLQNAIMKFSVTPESKVYQMLNGEEYDYLDLQDDLLYYGVPYDLERVMILLSQFTGASGKYNDYPYIFKLLYYSVCPITWDRHPDQNYYISKLDINEILIAYEYFPATRRYILACYEFSCTLRKMKYAEDKLYKNIRECVFCTTECKGKTKITKHCSTRKHKKNVLSFIRIYTNNKLPDVLEIKITEYLGEYY